MMNWTKSSRCDGANCVEVAHSAALDRVYLRDSKHPNERNHLVFTLEEWDVFVKAVKDGEFDL